MKNFICLLAVVFLTLASLSARAESGRLRQILETARQHHGPGCGFEKVGSRGLESMESVLESAPAPVPGTEIKTARFTLRTVDMSDFEAVKKVWGNEEVAKMSGDHLGDGDIQGLLMMGRPNFNGFRRGTIVNFGIYDGDKLLGMCQLGSTAPERPAMKGLAQSYNENWAEVSYHLHPDAWSTNGKYKGVATEVATMLVRTAMSLPGVDGVQGQAIVTNEGSQKVLAKSGMKEIDRFLDPSPWGHGGGSVYFAVKKADYVPPASQ